jgi:hypothetical protein
LFSLLTCEISITAGGGSGVVVGAEGRVAMTSVVDEQEANSTRASPLPLHRVPCHQPNSWSLHNYPPIPHHHTSVTS